MKWSSISLFEKSILTYLLLFFEIHIKVANFVVYKSHSLWWMFAIFITIINFNLLFVWNTIIACFLKNCDVICNANMTSKIFHCMQHWSKSSIFKYAIHFVFDISTMTRSFFIFQLLSIIDANSSHAIQSTTHWSQICQSWRNIWQTYTILRMTKTKSNRLIRKLIRFACNFFLLTTIFDFSSCVQHFHNKIKFKRRFFRLLIMFRQHTKTWMHSSRIKIFVRRLFKRLSTNTQIVNNND